MEFPVSVAQSKSRREELSSHILVAHERLAALAFWSLPPLDCPIRLPQICISISDVYKIRRRRKKKKKRDWWAKFGLIRHWGYDCGRRKREIYTKRRKEEVGVGKNRVTERERGKRAVKRRLCVCLYLWSKFLAPMGLKRVEESGTWDHCVTHVAIPKVDHSATWLTRLHKLNPTHPTTFLILTETQIPTFNFLQNKKSILHWYHRLSLFAIQHPNNQI